MNELIERLTMSLSKSIASEQSEKKASRSEVIRLGEILREADGVVEIKDYTSKIDKSISQT